MSKIILITGGVRSGKSKFVTKIANKNNKKVAYIATSPYYDGEMNKRIQDNKKERPDSWTTFEEQIYIPSLLQKINGQYDLVIIDCLSLYVTNHLLANSSEIAIYEEVNQLIQILKEASFHTIIVSNEVGTGVHPNNKIARNFIDIIGNINQMISDEANHVYRVFSGIPVNIKELQAQVPEL